MSCRHWVALGINGVLLNMERVGHEEPEFGVWTSEGHSLRSYSIVTILLPSSFEIYPSLVKSHLQMQHDDPIPGEPARKRLCRCTRGLQSTPSSSSTAPSAVLVADFGPISSPPSFPPVPLCLPITQPSWIRGEAVSQAYLTQDFPVIAHRPDLEQLLQRIAQLESDLRQLRRELTRDMDTMDAVHEEDASGGAEVFVEHETKDRQGETSESLL